MLKFLCQTTYESLTEWHLNIPAKNMLIWCCIQIAYIVEQGSLHHSFSTSANELVSKFQYVWLCNKFVCKNVTSKKNNDFAVKCQGIYQFEISDFHKPAGAFQ